MSNSLAFSCRPLHPLRQRSTAASQSPPPLACLDVNRASSGWKKGERTTADATLPSSSVRDKSLFRCPCEKCCSSSHRGMVAPQTVPIRSFFPKSLLSLLKQYLLEVSPSECFAVGCQGWLSVFPPFKFLSHLSVLEKSLSVIERQKEKSLWFAALLPQTDFNDCISFSCGLLRFIMSIKEHANVEAGQSSLYNRFHRFYHNAHKLDEQEQEIFKSPTISQLISVPFTALQLFSSVISSVTERVILEEGDGMNESGGKNVREGSSIYPSFFEENQRKVLVAACTLLAWKLSDADASVHVFQLPGSEEVSTEAHNKFSIFQSTRHSVSDIVKMEQFVFRELFVGRGVRVVGPPLWWRVALEVMQVYYNEYQIRAIKCRCAALAAVVRAGTFHSSEILTHWKKKRTYLYQREQIWRRKLHFGLEQVLLFMGNVLSLPGLLCGSNIESKGHQGNRETLNEMEKVLIGNPLLGFVIAVYKGDVPLNWVASLSGEESRSLFLKEMLRLHTHLSHWDSLIRALLPTQ